MYKPGESGEIIATFKIGEKDMGTEDKAIFIESDDPQQSDTTLKMRVVIPAIMEISPKAIYWDLKELRAKSIHVAIAHEFPLQELHAISADPHVIAEVKTVNIGSEYRVIVTPKGLASPYSANLAIRAKGKDGLVKTVDVYLRFQ